MTVREHLKKSHEHQADHHTHLAKHHKAMSKAHSDIADHYENDPKLAELHKALSDEHAATSDRHAKAGEWHLEQCDKLANLETVKASGGYGINPDPGHREVRKIVRAGQPVDLTGVPVELESLVTVE